MDVTYSRPFLYSSCPIRVTLPLSCFPLRFALTYPRRLSCPLPRPLICQPLVASLVASCLVESCPLIGYLLVIVVVVVIIAIV